MREIVREGGPPGACAEGSLDPLHACREGPYHHTLCGPGTDRRERAVSDTREEARALLVEALRVARRMRAGNEQLRHVPISSSLDPTEFTLRRRAAALIYVHREALSQDDTHARPLVLEALDWQLVLANVAPPLSRRQLTRGARVYCEVDRASRGYVTREDIYRWVDEARGERYRDSSILFDVLMACVATAVPGQWCAEEFMVLAHRICMMTQPELDECTFGLMATEKTTSGEAVRAERGRGSVRVWVCVCVGGGPTWLRRPSRATGCLTR